MSFKIPVKEIVVNKDTQVRLLEDDGSAYAAADATPSAGGFILEGFLSLTLGSQLVLLAAATRIVKTTPSTGTAQVATFQVTATSAAKGDLFRIVSEAMDLTPTEFQNQNVEKRYQVSTAQTSANNLAAHIRDTINADKNAKVTATAATDTVTITAKAKSEKFTLYSTAIAGTFTVTVAPALQVNTYDSRKNVHYPVNFDIDQNIEFIPEYGATYNSYYFEVQRTGFLGGQTVASNINVASKEGFRVIAKVGSALITALDLLVTDMNV